jgi:TolB-like protein
MAEFGESQKADGSVPAPRPAAGADGKVFISYASQDVAIADALCTALEAAGLPCWIAPRDVRAGEAYAAAIVQAISSCRMLVLVLSKSSIESPHVLREVERASSKKRPVLSIRMDATDLPPELEYFLSANHWLDASACPIEQILPELIEAVRGGAGAYRDPSKESGRLEVQPAKQSSANRTVIALSVLIGLALAGFVADRFWLHKPAAEVGNEGALSGALPSVTAPVSDKSIAVLPFTDMSEKRDQEYFSDGMAEEIIDLLVKVPELKVPARTSSFYFKGKSTKIPEIARELGVAHVLEGSVRKSGDHLRVTAQLVRADNGYHLWSETYDRQLDDVFKMQDEIAGAVVKALKVSLLEREAPSAILTTNTQAYDLYLQACSLIKLGTSEDTLKAYADLQQAVRLDPKFGLAWATLAEVLTQDNVPWYRIYKPVAATSRMQTSPVQDWGPILTQVRADARSAAEQAIKVDPDLAESHAAMGDLHAWVDWDWTAADADFKRARELAPGNARITQTAAEIAIDLGRVSEGLQLANLAAAQDPLGGATRTIGWAQYVSGALDEAQASRRKSIELSPTANNVHFDYATVLLARREPQAALAEFEREIHTAFREVGLPLAFDALGRHSDADHAIALAEQKWANAMAYQIAYFYAARSDFVRSFYWLERAYEQRDGGLADMKVDPMLRNLRGDPRFRTLLRKMKLPD